MRVNLVSAGPVSTPAASGIPGFEKLSAAGGARRPPRLGQLRRGAVADVAMFLLSDLGRAISGEIVHADGGFHAVGSPAATHGRRRRGPGRKAGGLSLSAVGDRLHGPAVSVGVRKEDKVPQGNFLHVAHLDPALEQLRAGGADVVDDHLHPLDGARRTSVTPVPIAIEQADPGGVSWTKRMSSLTAWSWSAMKPTCT